MAPKLAPQDQSQPNHSTPGDPAGVKAAAVTPSVTDNDTVPAHEDVTCATCGRFSEQGWPVDPVRDHCATCGQHAHHKPCDHCGECMESGWGWGSRNKYCSTTCRVNGWKVRRRLEDQAAIWAAEHPEEAAEVEREQEKFRQADREADLRFQNELLAIGSKPPLKSVEEMEAQDAAWAEKRQRKERATNCEECGAELTDTVYVGVTTGLNRSRKVAVQCEACFGEVKSWEKPKPCEGPCGRMVVTNSRWNRRYHTYCGSYCASRITIPDHAARVVTCDICGTEFKPRRSDARYCSANCRQQAHRRKGAE